MKNIKKTVAISAITISFLSFSINTEPVKAQNFLTRLLFPYVKPPSAVKDFDQRFGKVPPTPQDYNPNGLSPYGYYGNKLEGLMGRDAREIIELDQIVHRRPSQTPSDTDAFFRYMRVKPFGDLEKVIRLENGNTAYMFYDWSGGSNGTPGTPDKTESITIMNPSTGVGGVYTYTVPGTSTLPTPSRPPSNCTTYIVADQNGKLIYWSYKGSSDSIDDCSSDMRRIK
jgi:hypothetical protein